MINFRLLGLTYFSAACMLLSCSTTKVSSNSNSSNSLDAQVEEIMNWWPGTFNNDKQIKEVEKSGQNVWRLDDSGEGGYLHLKSHYIKMNLPDIGNHVLYVEEYRDNQPTETYRQRIYTISADSAANLVRVKMWPFKDKKKYIGAWKNPAMLNNLTKEEISAYPDFCDLLVKKVNGKYEMVMNKSDCTFGEKTFNYEVRLSKNMFSYRDKITNKSDGSIISTAANFAYHDLKRIK